MRTVAYTVYLVDLSVTFATADFAPYRSFIICFLNMTGKKKQQIRKAHSQPQTSQQDDNYLSSQFLRLRHGH